MIEKEWDDMTREEQLESEIMGEADGDEEKARRLRQLAAEDPQWVKEFLGEVSIGLVYGPSFDLHPSPPESHEDLPPLKYGPRSNLNPSPPESRGELKSLEHSRREQDQ